MKKSKAILMVVCAMLLVAASVMGTLAYLTSTDEVVNTFSVGKVKITLDEAKVGEDGKALTGEAAARVKGNNYHLLPGHEYDKDPTVTVKAGSDESYIRMMVTVTFKNELTDTLLATNLDNIFTGYDATEWIRNDKTVSADNKTITYEYRYFETVAGAKNAEGKDINNVLPALFTGISVPDNYTENEINILNGMEIAITAEAIQADGFTDADDAWDNFPTT